VSSHRDGVLSETWVRRKCGLARCPRCEAWFVPVFHYSETWCPACAPAAARELGLPVQTSARPEPEREPGR